MNDTFDLRQTLQRFFEKFAEDFRAFDGALIARRYAQPYLALDGQGNGRVLSSRVQIAQYFQEYLDRYRSEGCRSCRFEDLQIAPIGTDGALASVTWTLLRENGGIVSAWRESYNLLGVRSEPLVYCSTDHAPQ